MHGIPSDKVTLHEGDIITVDTCATKNGFVGDSAYTFCVGAVSPEVQRLLRVTKEALYKGIEQAVEGNRVGDISYAVQSYCEANGYGVVREMVGHGIGRSMHETPEVPNYGSRGKGPLLRSGVTICIEPMITMGSKDLVFESDGWTTRTRDGKYAAHYEHAVAVRRGKAEILSDFDLIEKELKY